MVAKANGFEAAIGDGYNAIGGARAAQKRKFVQIKPNARGVYARQDDITGSGVD
jgi:hypothetical protein